MNQRTTARDLIELPGPFSFKVIVKPDLADQDTLLELARQVLAREPQILSLKNNTSRAGRFRSYTLELHIEVYEEIEALYVSFNEHPASVWVI